MFAKAKQSIFLILQKAGDQPDLSTIEYLRTCLRIFGITDRLEKFAENFRRLCEQEQPNSLWLSNFEEFLMVCKDKSLRESI